jgi:hypothetical protein
VRKCYYKPFSDSIRFIRSELILGGGVSVEGVAIATGSPVAGGGTGELSLTLASHGELSCGEIGALDVEVKRSCPC